MFNTLKTRCTSLLCLLAITLIPVALSAQVDTDGNTAGGGGLFSGTSSTTSTIIGLPVTTTVGIVLLISNNNKKSAQLEHYLNHNYEDVHASLRVQDSAMPATQDLASLFGISSAHRQDFAQLLVNEREALAPLLDDEQVSSEEAYTFALVVVEALQAHPTLSEDVQRQLDAHYELQAQ